MYPYHQFNNGSQHPGQHPGNHMNPPHRAPFQYPQHQRSGPSQQVQQQHSHLAQFQQYGQAQFQHPDTGQQAWQKTFNNGPQQDHPQSPLAQHYEAAPKHTTSSGPAPAPAIDYLSLIKQPPAGETSSHKQSSSTTTKTTKTTRKTQQASEQSASTQSESTRSAYDGRVQTLPHICDFRIKTNDWHRVEEGWLAECGEHIVLNRSIEDWASAGFRLGHCIVIHNVNRRRPDPTAIITMKTMFKCYHPPAHMDEAMQKHRAFMQECSRIPHWVTPGVCECAQEFGQKTCKEETAPLLLTLQDKAPDGHAAAGGYLFWHDDDGGNAVVAWVTAKNASIAANNAIEDMMDASAFAYGGYVGRFGRY